MSKLQIGVSRYSFFITYYIDDLQEKHILFVQALMLESLNHWGGVVDELDFAVRLSNWCSHGFHELNDTTGFDAGSTICEVCTFTIFTKNYSVTGSGLSVLKK